MHILDTSFAPFTNEPFLRVMMLDKMKKMKQNRHLFVKYSII